jgi:transcriptional regulator with XRE-family HTH domain
MALDQGPVVQSAILRNSLIRLRKEGQLTQEQVARDLEWSPSKLIRVEGGRSAITKTDLDALLTRYGVTSDGERGRLQSLNRAAREAAWWDNYRDDISTPYLNFVGYEAGATFIRQFVANVVPGLLQTAEYAEVLTAGSVEAIRVAPVVKLRLQRQSELARRSEQPYQYYVLDEAVIRRHVGIQKDPAIMPNQLNHIAGRAEEDERVIIRVIPFGSGAHGGLNVAGSFTLLEFNGGLPDLIYLDAGRGEVAVITGDDPEVSAYRDLFETLLEPAMSEDESIAFIRQAAEDMSLRWPAMILP